MEAQIKTPARVSGGYGRGRIRTFEGISHQIYSLTPLATWVHARGESQQTGDYPPVDGRFQVCGYARGMRAHRAYLTSITKSSALGLVLLIVMLSNTRGFSVLSNHVVGLPGKGWPFSSNQVARYWT